MTKEQADFICGILEGMQYSLNLRQTNEDLAKYASYNVGIEDCQKIIKAYASGELDSLANREE